MTSVIKSEEDFVFLQIFLITAVKTFVFTLIWLPIYVYRCLLVQYVQIFKPSFGKIMDHGDATKEEDFVNEPPKCALVFSMVLDGQISLEEIKRLFIKNVLEAKISNKKSNEDKLKYPEFQQYRVDFAGYQFWKDDSTFCIKNHVSETAYNTNFHNYSKIHQHFTNKTFFKERSPWEILLVKNYLDAENSLLILRCHHSFADAKSMLKIIVECLGQKELKMPIVKDNSSLFERIKYYALLPFYFIYVQVLNHIATVKGKRNMWMLKTEEEPLLSVGISEKVRMADVKAIAKKLNTTTSAVIMAAVAGGIAKCEPKQTKVALPSRWVLPKPDHPDRLVNHMYSGIMDLPTDLTAPIERLRKCSEIFAKMKTSNIQAYDKSVGFQNGTWFNPFRVRSMKNNTFPVCITNVASDSEGFRIGTCECSEFTMTCGPFRGASGTIICLFSYKDGIRMTATTKQGIFTETQTHNLVNLMAKEFEVLKAI